MDGWDARKMVGGLKYIKAIKARMTRGTICFPMSLKDKEQKRKATSFIRPYIYATSPTRFVVVHFDCLTVCYGHIIHFYQLSRTGTFSFGLSGESHTVIRPINFFLLVELRENQTIRFKSCFFVFCSKVDWDIFSMVTISRVVSRWLIEAKILIWLLSNTSSLIDRGALCNFVNDF